MKPDCSPSLEYSFGTDVLVLNQLFAFCIVWAMPRIILDAEMLSLSESVSLWVPCLQKQCCCHVSSFGAVILFLCLVFLVHCAL